MGWSSKYLSFLGKVFMNEHFPSGNCEASAMDEACHRSTWPSVFWQIARNGPSKPKRHLLESSKLWATSLGIIFSRLGMNWWTYINKNPHQQNTSNGKTHHFQKYSPQLTSLPCLTTGNPSLQEAEVFFFWNHMVSWLNIKKSFKGQVASTNNTSVFHQQKDWQQKKQTTHSCRLQS